MEIPANFTLAVRFSPGNTYESGLLLARATFKGTLELLTAAWGRVLGYRPEEFNGKTLCDLMGSNQSAAARAVAAILDERNLDPVNLTVHRRDGTAEGLTFHRRLDEYSREIFIVAEETRPAAATPSSVRQRTDGGAKAGYGARGPSDGARQTHSIRRSE
jgi:hypothetical protein